MDLKSALMTLSLAAALPAFGAPNPDRDAYFGETHIHTSWSVDAWVMGNRLTGLDEGLILAAATRRASRTAASSSTFLSISV